jgi:hypothetical protein
MTLCQRRRRLWPARCCRSAHSALRWCRNSLVCGAHADGSGADATGGGRICPAGEMQGVAGHAGDVAGRPRHFRGVSAVAPGLAVLIIRNASDQQIKAMRELPYKWAPGLPGSEAQPDFRTGPVRYYIEICGNPVVAEMVGGLAAHHERVLNFGLRHGRFVDASYVRWREVHFDALAARDEKRARDSILKLIDVSESDLNRILQGAHSIRFVPLFIERVS